MKTKKIVIAVLMATLVTAFIVGCIAPLDNTESNSSEKQFQSAPDGLTLVRLNIVNSKNSRTTRPDTSSVDMDSFAYFTLQVKTAPGGSDVTPGSLSGHLTKTQIQGASIPLAPSASYTFAVTAYNSSNEKLAFGVEPLAVTDLNKTLSIDLKEIVDGTGTGLFTVSKALFSGYGTALLSMSYLGPGGSGDTINNYDIKTNDLGATAVSGVSGTLKSGYYLMKIALTQTGKQNVTFIEVVHIYEGFTTTYDGSSTNQTPLPTLRTNLYTITYEYLATTPHGVAGTNFKVSEQVTHGNPITNSGITTDDTTKLFGGWFTSADSGVTLDDQVYDNTSISPPPTKIIKAQTLYAKWVPSTVGVTFTGVDVNWSTPTPPGFTGSATYSQDDNTISITIEVTTNKSSYKSFAWYIDDENGAEFAGDGAGTYKITIVDSEGVDDVVKWYMAGNHTIYLIATTLGDVPESGHFDIECTPSVLP
jgi:hypothetical protein